MSGPIERPRRRARGLRVRRRRADPAPPGPSGRRGDVPGCARIRGEDARRGPSEPGRARRSATRSCGSRSSRTSTDVADVVFCSLPHGASAELAPPLLEAGLRVIDLAGDFRLPASAYPDWYGFEHPSADWLGKAVYGLPELFGDQLPGAQLVANPGCFPTPVILGLAPLLSAGLVDAGPDPRRRQDRAVGRRPRRERGHARSPRPRRASARIARRAISTRRRWSAAWSSRPGSRPA